MMKQGKLFFGGLVSLNRMLRREAWHDARYTVLLDENTFENCLPALVSKVDAFQEADFVEVPVGEECKSLEVAAQVWRTLLESGADRQAVLVCLGGGAVCDLGGFVAAGYKRGIRHINVPTSLLAMVDAAIGGKTAIDFGGVKNSIGHFYPAELTVIEPSFLSTLPQPELVNGLMEMVKTAAVCDAQLYARLMVDNTIGKDDIMAVAQLKARVVKADPYDHGIRRILNFGHTFGHAVELFSDLPHGVAVGIGMKVAMYLSVQKIGLSEGIYNAYSQWLKAQLSAIGRQMPAYGLKDIEQMLPLMHQDKKNTAEGLRCVLLKEPGAAVIDVTVGDNEVRDAFLKLAR